MEKYVILDKAIGETPLSCAEKYRLIHPNLKDVPMAYAGRLDPMASGKLLILLGDECKNQTDYHDLDKEYEFSVLLGVSSDTHDVLGRLATCSVSSDIDKEKIVSVTSSLVGEVTLPYPHFSSKTVSGKPLHTWTLEERLHEIEIPTKTSSVYELEFTHSEIKSRNNLYAEARTKIDSIPPVTDLRKALGNDFRRVDVRHDWEILRDNNILPTEYSIIHFRCVASSGTYMRSLAKVIAEKLGTCGLAWNIHRTKIGTFNYTGKTWVKLFT